MKLFTQCPQPGGRRLAQKFAAALCVFFLAAVPALADGVRIGQVVQTQTNSQAKPELKLSSMVTQDPVAPGTKGSTQNGPTNGAQDGQKSNGGLSTVAGPGVTITNESAAIGVDIIEEGEVEGTICDCGEIFYAATPFPKWPFLFLSAVPVVFISKCCDEPNPQSSPTPTPTPPSTPTPTPTPPTSEVPEPASLLLFGTGLAAAGAAMRRRYAKARRNNQEDE